jgi:hypothetical protein
VDFLLIENNVIELMDLDETEFAIKEYTPAGTPAFQTYRACGIIVGDNGLCPRTGPYAHGFVLVRDNKIYYVDGRMTAMWDGLGPPAGRALQIAGAKHVHFKHNVAVLHGRNPLQIFRCGPTYCFNNKDAKRLRLIPGWNGDTDGHYDEPETIAEDVFVLAMLKR